ncbi:MAG: CBS domain-containing protein [Haloferacaceae archaeon]
MSADDRTRVGDVMSRPLQTISPDATVREAAAKMREHDISALLVTTAPPSIVTSSDVLDAVAAGYDTDEMPVSEVMTESVETVPPDLSLREVAAMMTSFDIKHLPVAEDDYVGMISSTDVTAHLA